MTLNKLIIHYQDSESQELASDNERNQTKNRIKEENVSRASQTPQ